MISWNVCRSLVNKLKQSDFLDVICKHDIICLYECWTGSNDSSDISLHNYVTYSIPRVHGKGGGIVIYIRECLKDYCSCIQTVCDSVVILKIERNVGKDVHLFVNYIPPPPPLIVCIMITTTLTCLQLLKNI